ncbi:conserved protein of unknown function [Nitrospira japonica]|uniref:Uncharacterized protein n=1 Tax=Nitrospira japonica TaxID=1325564 RepID=A0A1W1I9M4_9BACT|nr:hypothetical protein [Nitrospira japonica]SLM49569.1 conserved protein of unknown function [Nitrospira japonica]
MPKNWIEKHQLAGLDERERGFSRPVELEQADPGYRAHLQYEDLRLSTGWCPVRDAVLPALTDMLQSRGYRQLKTQMTFRGESYLGSQEPWVEYPDPPQESVTSGGWLDSLMYWFRTRTARN